MSWDYPVFLNLEARRCIVIGESWFTPGKVTGLLESHADVTLIAPTADPAIAELAEQGALRWERRDYRDGDLEGVFLAISTHLDKDRNEPIWREAVSRNVLFNAVDDGPRCSFSFPAIHRSGDLAIAISTNGRSPALGVGLRDRLAREIGPEYGTFVAMLGELRRELAARIPEFERRKELYGRLVSSDALEQIRAGHTEAARATLRALIENSINQRGLEPAQQDA